MKRFLMFIAVLAAVGLLLQVPKPVQDVPPAVVQIVTSESDGTVRTCSAFYINLTQLVTAAHCISQEGPPQKVSGEPLRVVRKTDALALLEQPSPAGVSPLKFAKRVEVGEKLVSFGYAEGRIFVGLQRNFAGKADEHVFLDGPLIAGMSGGPVVNLAGEVIGVNQATTPVLGIVCPVPEIQELLDGK